jgi:acyl dehydratase
MITPIETGKQFVFPFSLSQEDIDAFAKVTGDNNPIHWDENYASQTPFKKPIIHGMFGAAIFSRVLGTSFPGEGTIYMKQTLSFQKPMYVGVLYEAIFEVKEIIEGKHRALIATSIVEKESGHVVTNGEAFVMNTLAIP